MTANILYSTVYSHHVSNHTCFDKQLTVNMISTETEMIMLEAMMKW